MLSCKKKVSVTFAGVEDTGEYIIPDVTHSPRKLCKGSAQGTPKKPSYTSVAINNEDEKENSVDEEDNIIKPSQALIGDDDICGTDVYAFKTPKKSGSMTQKALASTGNSPVRIGKSPVGRRSLKKVATQTPPRKKSTRIQEIMEETGKTPLGKRSSLRLKKLAAHTPQRIRSRVQEDDSSEDEDSAESDSDESSSDLEECVTELDDTPTKNNRLKDNEGIVTAIKRNRLKKQQRDSKVEAVAVEDYFVAQCTSAVTSDHTLSRLEVPRMDPEQLQESLKGVEVGYKADRGRLCAEYRTRFNKWMYLLCNNYNLLFHGVGSKLQLIEEFRQKMVSDFNHVVVNGFFPSLTIKNILNGITEDMMQHKGKFRTPLDQCEFMRNYFQDKEMDFFLIIHNIDGPMLRAKKTQTILSLLAQVPGCHMIASIDHINAPLLWDQMKESRFNWMWLDVTTFEPYTEETGYENSLLVQQMGSQALSSLVHVMKSLTPNAKKIFLLLVNHQLENSSDSKYQGLAFTELYRKCREAFLVNSDLTLRAQLTEFKDHKLIRVKNSKKGSDGTEYLVIPLDNSTLVKFLDMQE